MRSKAVRRWLLVGLFATALYAALSLARPADHLRAQLQADAKGLKFSVELASHVIEQARDNAF